MAENDATPKLILFSHVKVKKTVGLPTEEASSTCNYY